MFRDERERVTEREREREREREDYFNLGVIKIFFLFFAPHEQCTSIFRCAL